MKITIPKGTSLIGVRLRLSALVLGIEFMPVPGEPNSFYPVKRGVEGVIELSSEQKRYLQKRFPGVIFRRPHS